MRRRLAALALTLGAALPATSQAQLRFKNFRGCNVSRTFCGFGTLELTDLVDPGAPNGGHAAGLGLAFTFASHGTADAYVLRQGPLVERPYGPGDWESAYYRCCAVPGRTFFSDVFGGRFDAAPGYTPKYLEFQYLVIPAGVTAEVDPSGDIVIGGQRYAPDLTLPEESGLAGGVVRLTATPEPAGWALIGTGLAAVAAVARRRRTA